MNEIIIGQTISNLRKRAGVTQDELASALHISAQAVSKWETNTCLPDTQTLPLIANYFNVSIDYLLYGKDNVYDDIYSKVYQKIASNLQMSKESYEEALKLYGYAHHGISYGNLLNDNCIHDDCIYEKASHISNENGLSLISGKGYGAIVTRNFFTNITNNSLNFAKSLFDTLSKPNVLLVLSSIISMSDISIVEMKEKLSISDDELEQAIGECISSGLIKENLSKHKILEKTYEITDIYHTCLCIIIATAEMQKLSLSGVSCCMGFGDYPISIY